MICYINGQSLFSYLNPLTVFLLDCLEEARNNYVLTNYYNDYTCNMVIDKLERTGKGESRARSSLYLYNVFPYLINDITVSNGPNQPLKFQASFYFEYSEAVTRD